MEVNDQLIDKLCQLACLEFDSGGKEEIKADLKRMIGFVEKLNEIDSSGIEPLLHMGDEVNVLRTDEVHASFGRKEALANAPSADPLYFKVPKVIRNPKE